MRAVLDPNVIISALLSRTGSPAKVLRRWLDGAFELIVSPALLAELERVFAYPKLRARIDPAEVPEIIEMFHHQARGVEDPDAPPHVRSPDPGDDYLIALAETVRAVIVSGDGHLLGLAHRIPVYSPAEFLARLEGSASSFGEP